MWGQLVGSAKIGGGPQRADMLLLIAVKTLDNIVRDSKLLAIISLKSTTVSDQSLFLLFPATSDYCDETQLATVSPIVLTYSDGSKDTIGWGNNMYEP